MLFGCLQSSCYTFTIYPVSLFLRKVGMSHRILLELINISNPSFEKGQESSVCVSDVVWKMDKIILLDCSMFFQTQCANLNVVIF